MTIQKFTSLPRKTVSNLAQSAPPLKSSLFSTPNKKRTLSQITPRIDREKNERRSDLVREMKGRQEGGGDISNLIDSLQMSDRFEEYVESAMEVFSPLAANAPEFDGKQMHSKKSKLGSKLSVSESYPYSFQEKSEKAVTEYTYQLLRSMEDSVTEFNDNCLAASSSTSTGLETPSNADIPLPENPYLLKNHQDRIIEDTGLKPDGILYKSRAASTVQKIHMAIEAKVKEVAGDVLDSDFGQIGDYIWLVWEFQPTRLLVPVLFLAGRIAHLVVFTRGGWSRYYIGPICYAKGSNRSSEKDLVCMSLSYLWFIMTLPAEEFGHFCPMPNRPHYLRLCPETLGSLLYNAELVGKRYDEFCYAVTDKIDRRVSPCGRMAHLYRTQYKKDGNDRPAIIKLSRTPVNRIPEGAVYDILKEAGITGIPEVYASGIIEENADGYRIEFLVLEDCGTPLIDYILEGKKRSKGLEEICELLLKFAKQIASILGNAYAAGVVHRDVSAGNIAIDSNGNAKLIDWGLAKVPMEQTNHYKVLVERWISNAEETTRNERLHDFLTGTPLYMGCRILAEANTRGLVDDIESLFYVILHALCSYFNDGIEGTEKFRGFRFVDTETFANARAACVSSRKNYLHAFGIPEVTPKMESMLKKVLLALFYRDNDCIALEMISWPDEYIRDFKPTDVFELFEGQTIQELQGVDLGNSDNISSKKNRVGMESNNMERQVSVSGSTEFQGLSLTDVGQSNSALSQPMYVVQEQGCKRNLRSGDGKSNKKHKVNK